MLLNINRVLTMGGLGHLVEHGGLSVLLLVERNSFGEIWVAEGFWGGSVVVADPLASGFKGVDVDD